MVGLASVHKAGDDYLMDWLLTHQDNVRLGVFLAALVIMMVWELRVPDARAELPRFVR
jgi:hypothetical protein